MGYRDRYEFSRSVKREAKERAGWKCEQCGTKGTKQNRLEVDHKVAIWFAHKYQFLAPAVIQHIANAQVLCQECHEEKHRKESIEGYKIEAAMLIDEYAGFLAHALATTV